MLLLRKDAHVVVWVRWWASELTIGVVVALSREIRFGFSLLTWKLKSPAVMATDLVDGSLLASWVYLLRALMTFFGVGFEFVDVEIAYIHIAYLKL